MEKARQIFDLTTFNINKILTQEFLLNMLYFWWPLLLNSVGFDSSSFQFLYEVKSKTYHSRLDKILEQKIWSW